MSMPSYNSDLPDFQSNAHATYQPIIEHCWQAIPEIGYQSPSGDTLTKSKF